MEEAPQPMNPIVIAILVLVLLAVIVVVATRKPAKPIEEPEETPKKPLPDREPKPKIEKEPEGKKPEPAKLTKPEQTPKTDKPEQEKPSTKPEQQSAESKPSESVKPEPQRPAEKVSEPPKSETPAVSTSSSTTDESENVATVPSKPEHSATEAQPAATAQSVADATSAAAKTPQKDQADELVSSTPSSVVEPGPATARHPRPHPKKDISALRKGLSQTRGSWVQRLVGIFGGKKEIDPELLEQIQETLLTGDVGPATTERLTTILKDRLSRKDIGDPEAVWETLRQVAYEIINVPAPELGAKAEGKKPLVILVVGVNGVGKTTTIGKLAARYKDQGKKVYLAAADTFRAAAVAQLEMWGKRVGVPVVKGKDLSKPSAVVFDAVQVGIKENADVVIADTAGRLHTKTPLMDELRKLRDAAGKALGGAPHEILMVLDSTTGQNGLIQVKEFREALDVTGIVLTKLDGTAKGGVILGVCDEHKLPVRFVGVGEKVDDLREFDAEDFTHALFDNGGKDDEAAA